MVELGVLNDINWLGVLVATLAYFVLGALWYSPMLFGKRWMRAAGIAEPAEGEGPGPAIYLMPLISSLLASVALAMIARAMNASGAGDGLELGLIVGLGFVISVMLTTATFETHKPEPWVWFALTAGYHFVGVILASIIVSVLD